MCSAPTVHIIIADNRISHDRIGIWLSRTVTAGQLSINRFQDVATRVFVG